MQILHALREFLKRGRDVKAPLSALWRSSLEIGNSDPLEERVLRKKEEDQAG